MTNQLKTEEHKELYIPIALIGILAVLSYGRLLFLQGIFEDDNCWLLSVYSSKNLQEFLSTGWIELNRIPQGTFLYYFLKLHKTTDYAYIIWQSINLALQVASPILLFLLANNLFKDKHPLSFFIACSLIIYPIDTTVPVFSNIYYRIGIILTLLSLYLTKRALAENIRWPLLIPALLLSGISHYVLIEGTMAIEPARLAVIGYVFYKKGMESKQLIKKSLAVWSPFLILCIPLVIYKLIFKPYGIYEGTYSLSLSFVFDWQMQKELLKTLLFQNWYVFAKNYISHVTSWSILLSISAVVSVLIFYLMKWKSFYYNRNIAPCGMHYNFLSKFKESSTPVLIAFILGIIFLIPPVIMYELAGRVPIFGVNSRHGVILQIGYTFLLGSVLYTFFNMLYYAYSKLKTATILVAIFIGLGVFFNNINLDLYFNSWQKQKQFWQAFTKRFQALPESATFFIDAKAKNQPYSYNLDTSYDLELPLNLLYAKSDKPEEFRKHRALAPDEWQLIEKHLESPETAFERLTHWGKDIIKIKEFIFIRYREDEFLVNREIFQQHSDILMPLFPAAYPLRHKLKGFY